jgi:hypothetical protein
MIRMISDFFCCNIYKTGAWTNRFFLFSWAYKRHHEYIKKSFELREASTPRSLQSTFEANTNFFSIPAMGPNQTVRFLALLNTDMYANMLKISNVNPLLKLNKLCAYIQHSVLRLKSNDTVFTPAEEYNNNYTATYNKMRTQTSACGVQRLATLLKSEIECTYWEQKYCG